MRSISVVIPCYRQAVFLGEAIDSVLAQSVPAHEIVVVDDGSPDATADVAARYSRVRYIRQDQRGVCHARNRGLRETTGTYVVFLDADDRLLPHHFEASLTAFERQPEAAFVCGDYRWFGSGDTWHHHRCDPLPDHYGSLLRHNFIGPPVVAMFRRDRVIEVGEFRPGLEHSEDQDLYLRLARKHPLHCHHRTVAEYRRHPTQSSQDWSAMLQSAMMMLEFHRPSRGEPRYHEAYKEGRRFRRQLYGKLAYWQGLTALMNGQWRRAMATWWIVARYDPCSLIPRAQRLESLKSAFLAGRV